MKMLRLQLFLFLTLLPSAYPIPAGLRAHVEPAVDIPKEVWTCLKTKYSVDSVTVQIFKGNVTYAAASIHNAILVGFNPINGWIVAGPDCGPASGVYDRISTYLQEYSLTVVEIWLECGDYPGWSPFPVENVKYLKELVAEGQKRGHAVGIRTTQDLWYKRTASSIEFSSLPLWVADANEAPFGGWTGPTHVTITNPDTQQCISIRGTASCSTSVDTNITVTTTGKIPRVTCYKCNTPNPARPPPPKCKENETCTGMTCYTISPTFFGDSWSYYCGDYQPDDSYYRKFVCAMGPQNGKCCNSDLCNHP